MLEFVNPVSIVSRRGAIAVWAHTMLKRVGKLKDDQRGGTAVEYGLILALVVLAAMGAIIGLASSTVDMWNNVAYQVEHA